MAKPWIRRFLLPGLIIAISGGVVMLAGNLIGGHSDAIGNLLAIVIWVGGFPLLEAIRRTRQSK